MLTLQIKNMVCGRCKRVVRESLEQLGLTVLAVELGEAQINELPSGVSLEAVRKALQANEFDLLDDRKAVLIEQIKTLITQEVYYQKGEKPEHQNFSDFLAGKLGYEYAYLSQLFSSVEGMTVEKYIIAQKIEKVKELLLYDELSVSEIAWKLGYSSVQHLSNQFRLATGQTPGAYRNERVQHRRELDKLVP